MDCGCCAQDAGSLLWHQFWGSIIGRYRRGWAGIEMEGWRKCCPTRREGRGTPRFLSTEEEQELAEEVSSGRFRTAGEIRDWIESEYEVSYKPGGVYSLLHRLGCSPKVPRGLHEKADVLAQKSWKKGGLVSPLPERE